MRGEVRGDPIAAATALGGRMAPKQRLDVRPLTKRFLPTQWLRPPCPCPCFCSSSRFASAMHPPPPCRTLTLSSSACAAATHPAPLDCKFSSGGWGMRGRGGALRTCLCPLACCRLPLQRTATPARQYHKGFPLAAARSFALGCEHHPSILFFVLSPSPPPPLPAPALFPPQAVRCSHCHAPLTRLRPSFDSSCRRAPWPLEPLPLLQHFVADASAAAAAAQARQLRN